MWPALDPLTISELLHELAARLAASGATAGVRIVGGAAIALMNPLRDTTTDIDAALVPPGPIVAVVSEMAVERGLPADWLNAAALGFIPPVGLEDWRDVIRLGTVTIQIASPELLLAMKLFANRGTRDAADIDFLLGYCGVTSVEQAQEIYERYHAQDVLTDSAAARVQHWLDSRQ